MIDLSTDRMQWGKNGVEPYQWPLNRLESKDLYKDLIHALVDYGRRLENPEQVQILKILAIEICLITHAVFLAEKLASSYAASGNKVNIPEGYRIWQSAITNDYAALSNFSYHGLEKGHQPSPLWKRMLRPLGYFLIKGFKRGCLKTFNPATDIASITRSPLVLDHQKEIEKEITILSYDEWFYPAESPPDPWHGLDIVPALSKVAKKQNIDVSKQALNCLKTIINQNCGWVHFYLKRLDQLKVPQELWMTSLGSSFGRILAAKVLEIGGKVIVHDHAQGGNFSHDIHVAFHELQLTSEFITFTSYQADYYRKIAASVVISEVPTIKSFQSSDQVFNMPSHPVRSQYIQGEKPTILYPCPLIDRDISSAVPLMSGIEIIDWQCRLFKQLNQAGFQVHFKPHPLTKQPFPNYEDVFDLSLIDEPFEEALQKAQHVLFDWTLTTTFGNALSSHVPITIIDFGIAHYSELEKDQLKKRCHWIPGIIDATNKSQTDWDQLISVLNAPKEYGSDT